VPSEEEIVKGGLNLVEMNKLLIKKVEELTLYLIEKDKENKQLNGRLNAQQRGMDELKQQVELLMNAKK
jgi:hypothetical protein